MKAQTLYDFVNDGGASGNDLHDYFRSCFNGEPSPSGYETLPDEMGAKDFMAVNLYGQAHNSPSLISWCREMAEKYGVAVEWPAHTYTVGWDEHDIYVYSS
jgi:hypothetical protein